MRWLLAIASAAAAAHAGAAGDVLTLDGIRLERLEGLSVGASLVVEDFPDGFGTQTDLRFTRIDVYAHHARVVAVTAAGERELPRSRRIQLLGTSLDGHTQASLAFDPGFRNLTGTGRTATGVFAISARRGATGATLRAQPEVDTLPAGVVPQIIGGDDALPSGRAMPDAEAIAQAAMRPRGALRGAQIAVDTDNEFMSERFGNDTAAAADWIADLFGVMNAMYQDDLGVLLQQGAVYLRTALDPYTLNGSPASSAQLNEFGNYWQANHGGVSRDFAMLLSGKSSNANFASGIAWVNAYCQTQSQSGSYSVNQIFRNPQVGVAFSARIVGHELGHNFGAHHTHCTNAANGGAPTGTNTIDRCYSADPGCYAGPVSCPTSGPGNPLGTVMSYCNTSNGANCGQNVLAFHPTHIGALSALIAQNTPSCLSPSVDLIFANGFD